MTISISTYLGIDPAQFAKTGAFDAILDVDSKLFIDPHLLKKTQAPELQQSYDKVRQRFANIIKLLSHSQRKHDKFWRDAALLFRFNEVKGLCIGYSTSSTSGSGMGREYRTQLMDTAKIIIDAGIDDPEIFELMGLFEKGVGADRISDMVARIILHDLMRYSERIFNDLEVTWVRTFTYQETDYQLPRNPHNNWPIVLIPTDILRDLPMAYSFDDIGTVVAFNEKLRQRLNHIIGATWQQKRPTKQQYKNAILAEPEIMRQLVNIYRTAPPQRYDFSRDPAGQHIWYEKSLEYAEKHPLDLSLQPFPTAEDVLNVAMQISQHFKQLIEHNGLHTLLYRDNACTQPKHEEASQKLFLGIANAYCRANNLDISPETNSGRGAVDFKISHGFNSRVLVETKLSSNRNLVHGFQKQLIEYQKAEETEHAIYLIIDVGGCSKARWKEFRAVVRDAQNSDGRVPEIIIINGLIKLSASRYTGSY